MLIQDLYCCTEARHPFPTGGQGTCLYRICTAALRSAAQSDCSISKITIFIIGRAVYNFIHKQTEQHSAVLTEQYCITQQYKSYISVSPGHPLGTSARQLGLN